MRAPAQGDDQHGRGRVEAVAGREELVPGLQDRAAQGRGVAQVGRLAPAEAGVGVEHAELFRRNGR